MIRIHSIRAHHRNVSKPFLDFGLIAPQVVVLLIRFFNWALHYVPSVQIAERQETSLLSIAWATMTPTSYSSECRPRERCLIPIESDTSINPSGIAARPARHGILVLCALFQQDMFLSGFSQLNWWRNSVGGLIFRKILACRTVKVQKISPNPPPTISNCGSGYTFFL